LPLEEIPGLFERFLGFVGISNIPEDFISLKLVEKLRRFFAYVEKVVVGA
jgi:hypothetical protein